VTRHQNPFGLTNRERDILQMMTNGYSYKEVAKLSYLAESTVKFHMENVRFKMEASTTLQAVVTWIREVEYGDQYGDHYLTAVGKAA
jgi:DNA-binding CsgD family transcriptional regulator